MRLGCTTGWSPALLDDSCSSLMASLWESIGFFSSSVSVSVTESQPESKIKYRVLLHHTALLKMLITHIHPEKQLWRWWGGTCYSFRSNAQKRGPRWRKGNYRVSSFFPLTGFKGEIYEDIKAVEQHWTCLRNKQQRHSAEMDSPLMLDRKISMWMSNIRMISIWTHLTHAGLWYTVGWAAAFSLTFLKSNMKNNVISVAPLVLSAAYPNSQVHYCIKK